MKRLNEDDLDTLLVRPNKNLGNWRSPSLGSELVANYELLNITMKRMINEIETIYTQSLCSFRQRDKLLRQRFRYTLIMNNVTSNYRRIVAELDQRRISLATLKSLLIDAMSSLGHSYIPIFLLPPENFVKILDEVDKGVFTEAIPRLHLAAYYTFELVKDAYVSENTLYLLIEVPLYATNGFIEFLELLRFLNQLKVLKGLLSTKWRKHTFLCRGRSRTLPKFSKSSAAPIAAGRNASDSASSLLQPVDLRR